MHEDFENENFANEEFENEDFFLDVPTECPKCGSPLEVDTDYDKTKLLCTNVDCNYELDATEEFERAAKAYGMDEDEDFDED